MGYRCCLQRGHSATSTTAVMGGGSLSELEPRPRIPLVARVRSSVIFEQAALEGVPLINKAGL